MGTSLTNKSYYHMCFSPGLAASPPWPHRFAALASPPHRVNLSTVILGLFLHAALASPPWPDCLTALASPPHRPGLAVSPPWPRRLAVLASPSRLPPGLTAWPHRLASPPGLTAWPHRLAALASPPHRRQPEHSNPRSLPSPPG